MTRFFLFMLILIANLNSFSRQIYTVSGTIHDKTTGESLIGATVSVAENKTGAVTNEYGFFSISLPAGTYTINVSYTGYAQYAEKLILNKHFNLSIYLVATGKMLEGITVKSGSRSGNIRSPQMGMENLDVKKMASLPVILGEKDVMKTVQLLPGVKTAGEGGTGFYVRGGGADQNLILLDEAIVYNPSHLLGFFSVFNSDAIKNLTLYKGNSPAQYGGRLSSVMDIKMNDGNDQSYHASGGIGLIAARVNAEGPIVKNKGSFLFSARRTYADAFLSLSSDPSVRNNRLYFYDLNTKLNYKLSDRDRIYLSGYYGKDVLVLGDVMGINWGNATATFRWNHIFNPKLFSNTSIIYSSYKYDVHVNTSGVEGNMHATIKDWNIKENLNYYINNNHSLQFGLNSIYHTITPGVITGNNTAPDQPINHAWENALYISDNWKTTENLNIEAGIRLSTFSIIGGDQKFYTLDQSHHIVDTLQYPSGHIIKTYIIPEPRLSVSYQLNTSSSLKAAYARNAQYLHLFSNFITGNPIDKWVASNNIIQPKIADQFSVGYFRNFNDNSYECSAETYYKTIQHMADYKDNAQILTSNDPIETQLLFGRGRAYGIELILRKNEGSFTGWISYTLSKTELQIDGVNKDRWYPARQDRTHDMSIVGMYRLSEKWALSAVFVYYTGSAATFPSGKYQLDNIVVPYFTERNGYREPAYHRLDLGATMQLKKHKLYSSELAIGIYNAYGRQNAYTIKFQTDPDDASKTQILQTCIFRWVPSISYNFKF